MTQIIGIYLRACTLSITYAHASRHVQGTCSGASLLLTGTALFPALGGWDEFVAL